MRLLSAQTDTAAFIHRINIPVSYSALLFRITSTADADGLAIAEVGRIIYRIRQTTVVDADFAMISSLDAISGGIPETTFPAGATAVIGSILIPRGYFDDNVEFVTPQDTPEFSINFHPSIAQDAGTGFLAELYAIEEYGLQSYSLMIKQQELNIAGAGTIPDNVTVVENIAAIYLTDIVGNPGVFTLNNSPITRIRYTVGNLFSGEMSTAAALAKTNMQNRVETAQVLIAEVFAAKIGDISSKLEDVAQLTYTVTGAARPQMLTMGISFNPNKLSETAAIAAQRLATKLTQKEQAGKKRTANTVKAITNAA